MRIVQDPRAVLRILWHVFKDGQVPRLNWWWQVVVFVLTAYMAGQGLLPLFLPLCAIAPYFYFSSFSMSSRVLRTLPVERRDLGMAVWLLTVLCPALVAAAVTMLGARNSFAVIMDRSTFLDNALLGFSYLLVPIATVAAASCLRGPLRAGTVAPQSPVFRRMGIWALILGELGLLGGWAYLAWPMIQLEERHLTMPALVVGLAGVLISFILRKHLVFSSFTAGTVLNATPPAARAKKHTTPPKPGSWFITLADQFVWPVFSAVWIGFMTVPTCFELITKEKMGGVLLAAVVVMAGVLACLCVAWVNWQGKLRTWRMLPLDRAQLSQRIVVFSILSGGVPWLVIFVWKSQSEIARGAIVLDTCLFYLGIALLTQGLLLAVMPLSLRRFDDTFGTGLLKAFVFCGAFGMVVALPYLFEFNNPAHVKLAANGAVWLAVGIIVLCMGTVVSLWHTRRVLSHSNCYRKAER